MSGELEKLILGDIDVEINPSESTEERDVYNCLKTLYGSREGEQALDREFGLNMDCLSLPAKLPKRSSRQRSSERQKSTNRGHKCWK